MLGKHGHDIMHRLAGARRTRRIGSAPAELTGEWRYLGPRGPHQDFELTANGYQYIIAQSRSYAISLDGSHLDYAPFQFYRVYGVGSSLIGLWKETSTGEEVYFRNDGTATYCNAGDQQTCLPVKWQTTTRPDHLHWREARALVDVKGKTFTFHSYEFPDAKFSYKFVGKDKFELTPERGGKALAFIRPQ